MVTQWMKQIVAPSLFILISINLMISCQPSESMGKSTIRQQIRDRIRENVKNHRPESGTSPQSPRNIPLQVGTEIHTITNQNLQRTYLLYTPKTYKPENSIPLLIGLHGGRSQPQRFALTTRFNDLAEKEGFIVAYPAGVDNHWNDGRAVAGLPKQNDVAFISAMIDDIQKRRNIDRKKIYATGISNGGFMTQKLACELSHKIAAFASVAATLPTLQASHCHPNKPIPILIIHSPNDAFVPWAGGTMVRGEGGTILSAPQTMDFWRTNNRCPSSNVTIVTPKKIVEDGTNITISTCQESSPYSEVTLVRIDGGGHTWPSGTQQPEWLVGKTTQNLNSSEFIWNFFKHHTL